jgi:hypothetical protein
MSPDPDRGHVYERSPQFFEYRVPEHVSQQSQNGQNLVIKAVFKDFVLSNRVP